jgi:hypothetical protein
MAMSTDSKKDPSNSEKGKHFFACLRSCIPPALHTSVDTLCNLIHFGEIEPCNIFPIKVSVRECVVSGIGDGICKSCVDRGSGWDRHSTGRRCRQWHTGCSSTIRLHSVKVRYRSVRGLTSYLLVHFILEYINVFRRNPSF